jgi:hypothetical protein
MARKVISPSATAAAPAPAAANGGYSKTPELIDLLERVDRLLKDGEPGKALDEVARARLASPWATNAQGVCHLRLGNARVALDLFAGLVLGSVGVALRREAPAAFKVNYAAALMLSGNVSGGLGALKEVRDESNPAVRKLRDLVRRWRQGLTFWQKVNWWMGGDPDRPVSPDSSLGELQ